MVAAEPATLKPRRYSKQRQRAGAGRAVMLERPAELNTVAPEFLAKRPFA